LDLCVVRGISFLNLLPPLVEAIIEKPSIASSTATQQASAKSSIIGLVPTRSTSTHIATMAQKSDYEKVVLNVQYPWNNQGGTFALRVNEIVVKSDLKDVFSILHPEITIRCT